MPRWMIAVIPGAVVLAVGVAWWLTRVSIPPCEGFEATDLRNVHLEQGCVELTAQAHYEIVVKQRIPGNLIDDERQLYLFPLFAEGGTNDRGIRVLVRTERPPEAYVSFETMTVAGRLLPVTGDDVPPGTEVRIGQRSDYFFTDGMMLLVPDRITSDGEVWERP